MCGLFEALDGLEIHTLNEDGAMHFVLYESTIGNVRSQWLAYIHHGVQPSEQMCY
jgi:hypothetical protein